MPAPATLTVSPRRLRAAVLLTGTATMALQMCAVRLLAPWVGASSIVWATTIGLSLLAMSLGYVLGGRIADSRATGATLARALGAAALLVTLIPAIAPTVLPHAGLGIDAPHWNDLVGTAVAFGTLFLAPALLLGMTPPYAIRLAMRRVDAAGGVAGRLYALSTVGSIIGTLATALVLVQWIGTRASLWLTAAAILAAALLVRTVAAAAGEQGAAPTRAPAVTRPPLPMRLAGAIVLVEGMTMMATEMSIARLIAPFFGASHAVWAVIIATVMGSIALGSHLGGRDADRHASLGRLVGLLAIAAGAVAVLPFVATPLMRLSTGGIDDVAIGTVVGTFLATMLLLVVPVTLLGMVPPWVLRLAVPDVASAGRAAGRLYALSTAGALIGTFGSVLVLIPAIGTRRTMLLMAGALVLLAAALHLRGAVGRRVVVFSAVVLVAGLALAPTGLVKPLDDATVLEERESRYQFIQVVRDAQDRVLLQLNEGWAVHSIFDPDTVLTGGIWDHFLALPAVHGSAEDMLIIGSAAGTSKRAFAELHPQLTMTSVELDTQVTEVGRRYFELTGDVTASDGRPFLARTRESWDLIHVDAYRQPYIPFYLTTREFFELADSRLRDGGVFSINVGSSPSDPRINEAIAATMREVFPIVLRYRPVHYNEVIVGVADPNVTVEQLRARLNLGAGESTGTSGTALARIELDFARGMQPVQPDPGRVMTDDRAPVEWMTDRMIFGEAG